MLSTNRTLVYSAMFGAALVLASCSSPDGTGESGGTPQAAAAQHRFTVYFDVGKSGLTPEARQVVAQAIAEANQK